MGFSAGLLPGGSARARFRCNKPCDDTEAQGGERFLGTVPNFVQADWDLIWPAPRVERAPARRGRRTVVRLRWVVLMSVINQRCSEVVLPDVLLAQCVWGARPLWPHNWRQSLRAAFYGKPHQGTERPRLSRKCPPACPLHGQAGPRHRHVVHRLEDPERILGCLQVFATGWDPDEQVFLYDFGHGRNPETDPGLPGPGTDDEVFTDDFASGPEPETLADAETPKDRRKVVRALRKEGRLVSVYLPALLFGPSPRSGLTRDRQNVLVALARELTRASNGTREDRGALLVGGQKAEPGRAQPLRDCPFLKRGARYVGFNGNGGFRRRRFRGRGYRLVGKTGNGWLARAGYAVPSGAPGRWKAVRRFLKDLLALAGPFGLVAAGWHPGERVWHPLAAMVGLTRTRAGRTWLANCLLRVYTAEDYLLRWRRYFARQLGFAFIPGDSDEEGAAAPDGSATTIASALDLDRWLRTAGLTDQELAARLGVSRSYVSSMHSGRRPWSVKFQAKVTAVLEGKESGQGPCGKE